jgi:hypothetical protein
LKKLVATFCGYTQKKGLQGFDVNPCSPKASPAGFEPATFGLGIVVVVSKASNTTKNAGVFRSGSPLNPLFQTPWLHFVATLAVNWLHEHGYLWPGKSSPEAACRVFVSSGTTTSGVADMDEKILARIASWRDTLNCVTNGDPLTEHSASLLWRAAEEDRRRMRMSDDGLETYTVNAIIEFSRWLASLIRQSVVVPHGLRTSDLNHDDRQHRSDAWQDLIAIVIRSSQQPKAEHTDDYARHEFYLKCKSQNDRLTYREIAEMRREQSADKTCEADHLKQSVYRIRKALKQ